MLHRHTEVSAGIREALEAALQARNRLIHRVFTDNIEKLLEADGRAELLAEIKSLRSSVQKGEKSIRPFNNAFNSALPGLDLDELEAQVRKALS